MSTDPRTTTARGRPRQTGAPARPGAGPDLRALAVLGVGVAFLYVAAALRFPLLAIYDQPLQNLDRLTAERGPIGLVLLGYVLLLFGSYALGLLALRGSGPPDARWRGRALTLALFGLPLLFVAALLLTYPTTSLDLYDYLFRGRMLARYGANTFTAVPQDFPSDPLMSSRPTRFIPWSRAVTAYGPLWEGMSWLTARLAGERPGPAPTAIDPWLRWLILGYKGLGALGYLLCGLAIWAALARADPRSRVLGTYLWLWNPLALWESVAAGHNDAWMALLIVLSVWAASGAQGLAAGGAPPAPGKAFSARKGAVRPDGRPILAFLILTLGGLIKYSALFLGPLLLASALRQSRGWRAGLRLTLLGGLACLALVALAYAPFWAGAATFKAFGDRGTLFTASWLAVLQALLVERGWMDQQNAQALAATAGLSLLAAGVCWSAAWAWLSPRAVARQCFWLMSWFLLVCSTWFQPWYLLWALALVALQPRRADLVRLMGLFCCTAMLSYVANSFLRPALDVPAGALAPESARWNLLLCLLIYAPPLLTLLWRATGSIRVRRSERLARLQRPSAW